MVFILKPINSQAQYVLNGSFEDEKNTLPYDHTQLKLLSYYFNNVEARLSYVYPPYPFLYPVGNILKDTCPVGWIDSAININRLFGKWVIPPAPHGKTYIILRPRSAWGQYVQVVFKLSDTMRIGKRYNISFYSNYERAGYTNWTPIVVGFGKTNTQEEITIDSIYLYDSTFITPVTRRYVMSMVAKDNYQYLYLYEGERTYLNYYMVDDIRLDTCVTMLPVIYKSCVNFPDTLKPTTVGKKYYWNTGDTTTNIVIKKTGNYRAYVYDSLGCCNIDSFVVTDYALNIKAVDISKCVGVNETLKATNANSYKWNTGDTTQTITIDKGGLFWVTRSTPTCTLTDTFKVTEHALPIINVLPDTTVCFSNIAQILLDAGSFKSYLWKPTNDTTRIIYSKAPQTYNLQVTDSNNCKANKTITVIEKCEENIYIPNAFTPNGDGLNDVFNIVTTGLEKYAIQIYNRWGQEVFSSDNYLQGWDGKNAPNDVYVYQITYKVNGKPANTIKGTVTLMR